VSSKTHISERRPAGLPEEPAHYLARNLSMLLSAIKYYEDPGGLGWAVAPAGLGRHGAGLVTCRL